MKYIIRTKLISIFVILTSIHFIYSGCCGCCGMGKGSESCNKSNSKGKPSSQDAGKPGKPGKPDTGVKPGYIPAEGDKPEEIPVIETPEDKKKKEDEKKRNILVKRKILDYLNTRDGKRVGIDTKIKFNITQDMPHNGWCIAFTNGRFAGLIKNDETNKIKEDSDNDLIGSLKITIQIHNNTKRQTYNFTNKECTLEQLVKSLNTLNEELRADPTEYLHVRTKDEVGEYRAYINLNNGIIYCIHTDASDPFNLLMRDAPYLTDPLYCNGIFYSQQFDAFTRLEDQKKAAEEFNKPLPDNDISKYNLTIAF